MRKIKNKVRGIDKFDDFEYEEESGKLKKIILLIAPVVIIPLLQLYDLIPLNLLGFSKSEYPISFWISLELVFLGFIYSLVALNIGLKRRLKSRQEEEEVREKIKIRYQQEIDTYSSSVMEKEGLLEGLRNQFNSLENDYHAKFNKRLSLEETISTYEEKIASSKENLENLKAQIAETYKLLKEKQGFLTSYDFNTMKLMLSVINTKASQLSSPYEGPGVYALGFDITAAVHSTAEKISIGTAKEELEKTATYINEVKSVIQSRKNEFDEILPMHFLSVADSYLQEAQKFLENNNDRFAMALLRPAKIIGNQIMKFYEDVANYGYMLAAIKRERDKSYSF